MPEISKQQLVVYVAAAIAIALIGARYLRDSRSAQRVLHWAAISAGSV